MGRKISVAEYGDAAAPLTTHTSMIVIGWLGGTSTPFVKLVGNVLSVSREARIGCVSVST